MIDLTSMLNGASGGLLGLGGSLASQVVKYFADKQKAKDELAARQADYAHDIQMAGLTRSAAADAARDQLEQTRVQGDIEGLKAAIADQTQAAGRVDPWVANILALVRPGLTVLLVLGLLALAAAMIDGAHPELKDAFETIAWMASVAITWWFGSRDHQKAKGAG